MPVTKKKPLPVADLLTSSGAGVLAKAIETHWRERGFAGIVAERYLIDGSRENYGVRSNIGPDGYPPRVEVVGLVRKWSNAAALA